MLSPHNCLPAHLPENELPDADGRIPAVDAN